MEKLKPCSFCGASAIGHKHGEAYMISCNHFYVSQTEPRCGAAIVLPTEKEAAKAWNRRYLND